MKVIQRKRRLDAVGATAVFVVHDEPELVRRMLLADVDCPYPVCVDMARTAYREWGMRRASMWRILLDPRVWRDYARLLGSGERLRGFGRDTGQLGGDFVVDRDGFVVYARPQQRDDRPPVGELLEAVEELT